MTGAGDRAFCAGRDLREFVGTYGGGVSEQTKLRRIDDPDDPMFGKLCNHFHIKKPMIAALNGYAVGGGLQMSLMADIRIMADDTYIAAMQGKANVTGGGELAWYFPWSVANYILMGNARIPAQQCLQYGFVVKICPRAELIDNAIKIANEIMVSGPDALRYFKEESLKRQVMSGGIRSEEELEKRREESRARVLRMRDNPDLIEGMKAFVENRSADYEKTS
jgi:E-phenylitaconyl-CoA hydratase